MGVGMVVLMVLVVGFGFVFMLLEYLFEVELLLEGIVMIFGFMVVLSGLVLGWFI